MMPFLECALHVIHKLPVEPPKPRLMSVQEEHGDTLSTVLTSMLISCSAASPLVMRVSMSYSQPVPSRQGVH